ncbi:MAG: TMEM175 family protein [Gemmatimonadetes bacterium]|nr:TMEM175 family protein [Gemmatimonadota bacterium]
MESNRLEAFSDGVLAIIITIMVLELKVPHGAEWSALTPLLPVFVSYVLSFIYVGIYWNNHHHLLKAVDRIGGGVLWANLHLLFWLSLFPFAAGYLGENHFAAAPTALYGIVLLMAGLAYTILVRSLLAHHEKDSALARAIGRDRKGMISLVLYAAGIGLSFVEPWAANGLYVTVAVIWLVPDPRIERELVP